MRLPGCQLVGHVCKLCGMGSAYLSFTMLMQHYDLKIWPETNPPFSRVKLSDALKIPCWVSHNDF